KAEQERMRQRQAEQQHEQERRQAEEQKAREKAEKKRQLEEQKLAEKTRRRIEALQSQSAEGGKTVVVVSPNVLKDAPLLAAGGAVLLVAVVVTIVMLIPGAVPVEFQSTPLGTTVRVVSTGEECVTPHCSIQLRPGKHELEFSHPGYTTQRQTISVQAKGQ